MNIKDCFTIPLEMVNDFCEEQHPLLEFFGCPGIIGIHCFDQDSTYFFHTPSCWLTVGVFCSDLVCQRTTDSIQLSDARSFYGLKSLAVIFFHVGPKWKSIKKREKRMQLIMKNWQHNIYTK